MENQNPLQNGALEGAAGNGGRSGDGSALIFLGTGCSSAVPNAMCLIQPSDPPCQILLIEEILMCNSSLLIDYCSSDGIRNYIIIDVGKTFREQVLRWFTFHKIPRVDSIVLTHEHADAILGLDDIRAIQPHSPTNDIDPTAIYLTRHSMDGIATKFPYLVQKKLREGQEVRRVAQLDLKIIEEHYDKPFVASGLTFFPLPVMHGEDYLCLGYLFGEKCKVAYISDVSLISKNGAGQLDLLILDCLYKKGSFNVHLCLPQTLEAIKRICPKRALLIGMTHEFDHHKDNEFLMEWSEREGIHIQLARDGLRVPIDL
ncbi:hypothetical protein ES332_D06G183200v1 [Gossypium tomentosum]|uniref:Metallo-beta-lactamase domain-containing protein n=1 Tax=Gossypium tomentosum TaxID=34277 RepID=A0A5D2KJQ7_GOSTO|nr:hypothetical protein ES332_D06G183200v1 [Gossypium tomentosum]